MSPIDTLLFLLSGVLGGLSGALVIGVLLKRTIESDIVMEKIDDFLTELQTNKDLQAKIYTAGALLGQGIQGGLGLQKKGGKFNMNDIFGLLAQRFLGNFLGGQPQEGQPEPTANVNSKIGL